MSSDQTHTHQEQFRISISSGRARGRYLGLYIMEFAENFTQRVNIKKKKKRSRRTSPGLPSDHQHVHKRGAFLNDKRHDSYEHRSTLPERRGYEVS